MILQEAISQVTVDLPKEFLFAIIALLLGFIGWVGIKYYNRLETILDRVETAIEGILVTNKLLQNDQEHMREGHNDHERRISKLEDAKKNVRR